MKKLVKKDKVDKVLENLEAKGFVAIRVKNKIEALDVLKKQIHKGNSVTMGSSTTLDEIGIGDFLKENAKDYKNYNSIIWSENDEQKRAELRRQSLLADVFISSVNALTEDGALVAVDATGSRVGAMPFAAKKVVIVVGKQKIVKNLDGAFKRIKEEVFPKEDARLLQAYGFNSTMAKWVILERELEKGRITVILVDEELGF